MVNNSKRLSQNSANTSDSVPVKFVQLRLFPEEVKEQESMVKEMETIEDVGTDTSLIDTAGDDITNKNKR